MFPLLLIVADSALLPSGAARPSLNCCSRVSAPPLLRAESQPPAPAFSLPPLLQPELGIAGGLSLMMLLVGNRLFTPDLLNSQSRADLIATVGPVLIVLKALSDLDITPKEADPVPLLGTQASWVDPSLPTAVRAELEWAAETLLVAPCAAVALWRDGRTLLLSGTLSASAASGEASAVAAGTLLTKAAARKNGAPDYLPALQLVSAASPPLPPPAAVAHCTPEPLCRPSHVICHLLCSQLPGRVEFSYFPENTQGVLMLPLVGETPAALILAVDRQRGFGEEDIEYARAVAARVAEVVASAY